MEKENNKKVKENDKRSSIHQPHDKLFKKYLSYNKAAKEFFVLGVDAELLALCNLDTIKLSPNSFIEPNFSAYYSDLLYSVDTKEGENSYIYFLIEHQSTPDKLISFRLMSYAMDVLRQHIAQYPNQITLPLIYPILFYSGERKHPESITLNWLNLFHFKGKAKEIYTSPFQIVDLSKIEDKCIDNLKNLGALLYVMRDLKQKQVIEILESTRLFFCNGELAYEQIKMLLLYLFDDGKIDNYDELIEALESNSEFYRGGDTVTFTEYLKQIGREEGIREGILAGRQEAATETTKTIARNLLNQGVDLTLICSVTGLSIDEIKLLMK
ncbi:Rpn family recombination-promoting nuclease/putative transposase [Orbaceae bacterium ESL0721]|nr:Rpn family recombination-promoting nuclease/putative transposase [Orbaceae bacterium ESL0721]